MGSCCASPSYHSNPLWRFLLRKQTSRVLLSFLEEELNPCVKEVPSNFHYSWFIRTLSSHGSFGDSTMFFTMLPRRNKSVPKCYQNRTISFNVYFFQFSLKPLSYREWLCIALSSHPRVDISSPSTIQIIRLNWNTLRIVLNPNWVHPGPNLQPHNFLFDL